MPVYVYKSVSAEKSCEYCKDSFEFYQSISAETLTECPKCHAPIYRVIQAVGVQMGKKFMMEDSNLKKHGFTKLVNEGGGKFRKI